MENKFIYLLVGASGSGKSTVAELLEHAYGWRNLESYTTRKPRFVGERGHIFITKEKFDKLENKCGYTVFDGNEYCATSYQIDRSDVYIIDPAGVDYFIDHYNGDKIPIIVLLKVSDGDAIYNMSKRGDDYDAVLKRRMHDKCIFDDLENKMRFKNIELLTCVSDENNSPEVIAKKIYEHRLWMEEKYEKV